KSHPTPYYSSHYYAHPKKLLSFPTRRSSDLKMDDQKQRGRRLIAKNTIFNLTGQILPMVAGVVTIPFIVRGLGAAEYGILSIAINRKSTRLNSSHQIISYAVFCLKKNRIEAT